MLAQNHDGLLEKYTLQNTALCLQWGEKAFGHCSMCALFLFEAATSVQWVSGFMTTPHVSTDHVICFPTLSHCNVKGREY